MAVVTRTIGTSSRNYSTITLWEADLDDGGIYSSSDDAVGECYDDSAFDESVIINGGGTVGLASTHLTVASGERHDGTAGSGARIERTAAYSHIIQFAASYGLQCSWLEIDGNGNSNQNGACCSQTTAVDAFDRAKQVWRNMLIHPESTSNRFIRGIDAGTRPLRAMNNIVYNVVSTGASGSLGQYGIGNDDRIDIINNTVYNVSYSNSTGNVFSFGGDNTLNSANAVARNNLAVGLTGGSGTNECYQGSLTSATTQTNGSSDSTGTSGLQSLTASNLFVSTTGGSEDLHLKSGADAIDEGTDLATTPTNVNIDINGRDRDSEGDTWDLGAHEFVAAGTTIDVPVGSITLTGLVPTITATDDKTVSVPTGSISLTGLVPTVITGADVDIEVPTGSISLTGQVPTVVATDNKTVVVPVGSITLTGQTPTILTGDDKSVEVPVGSITLTGLAPTVVTTDNKTVNVPTGTITLSTFAPTVVADADITIDVPTGTISLTGIAPTILTGDVTLTAQDIQNIVDAIFGYVVENSETFAEQLRLIRAEAAGKLLVSGTTVTIRDAADSKDRIIATVDNDGQRTSVSTDAS